MAMHAGWTDTSRGIGMAIQGAQAGIPSDPDWARVRCRFQSEGLGEGPVDGAQERRRSKRPYTL